jgi:hypothetical protein
MDKWRIPVWTSSHIPRLNSRPKVLKSHFLFVVRKLIIKAVDLIKNALTGSSSE